VQFRLPAAARHFKSMCFIESRDVALGKGERAPSRIDHASGAAFLILEFRAFTGRSCSSTVCLHMIRGITWPLSTLVGPVLTATQMCSLPRLFVTCQIVSMLRTWCPTLIAPLTAAVIAEGAAGCSVSASDAQSWETLCVVYSYCAT